MLLNNIVMREKLENCPFCMTEINQGASVCTGCGAQKGITNSGGKIYGRTETIIFGIILPIIFSIMPFIIFGFNVFFFILVAIMAIPLIHSVLRLKSGGVWYRKE